MVGTFDDPDSGEEFDSDLIDVTGERISELLQSEDSVLSNSIRRVLAETADNQEVVAGHGENIDES